MRRLTWAEGIFPVLDFETTGLDLQNDRVIQAALILEALGGYILPGSIVTYVNPGEEAIRRMEHKAVETHGITQEIVRVQGRDSQEVFQSINSILQAIYILGLPLLIYNAPFDWRFVHYELRRHNLPEPPPLKLIDPLVIDYRVDKYRKGSRKLSDVARHYGVELTHAHDAQADCVATAETFRKMLKAYPRLAEYSLDELHRLQELWFARWRNDRNRYWASQGREDRIDYGWPGI
ncbi:MAG TPA: exonuclease domain-containing protein [Bacillota bacterium]|nr:exonuclease domain-containing protein [Bacillota bacterium]HPT60994.1 exonuclease domain-containing protein [Bacillota bacterium]